MSKLICSDCYQPCILHENSETKMIYAYCPVHGVLADCKPADNIKLQAELKLYKRVATLAVEALEYNKLNEISSCHDYDCRKDLYNSSEDSGPCIKCMIDYFITKAKEE